MENRDTIRDLLKLGLLEVPDRDFDNKVMEKIRYVYSFQRQKRMNLKFAWIFLILSAILVPGLILSVPKICLSGIFNDLGISVSTAGHVIMPAVILVSAIIILIQVDNLYHLSLEAR